MVATTLPATVRVVDLPTGTTVTGAELIEAVQTSGGVGQSVQLSLNTIATSLGIPSGGATGTILNKSSGSNYSTQFSAINTFVNVGTSLATTGSATSIVAFVANQGITSTQIANNAVGTNQIASSLGIASSLSIGTLLTVGGTATITGTTILNGGLQVTGTSLLTGTFGVVGTSQFTGAFNVVGTSLVTGTLGVVGTTLFTSGTFGIVGTTIITGTFGQIGTSLMTGQFGVSGTTVHTGTFTVLGTTVFTGGFNFSVIGTTLFTSGTFGVAGTTLFTSGAFGVVGTTLFTSGTFGVVGTTLFTSGAFGVVGTTLFTSGAFGVVGTTLFTSGAFGVVGTAVVTGTLGVVGTTLVTGTFILGSQGAGFLQSSSTGVVTSTPNNFVLLNTLTPAGVGSASDTSSFTSTYKNYLITLEGLISTGNTATFQMQVATSGANFISGGYVSYAVINIAAAGAPIDSSTTALILSGIRATTAISSSALYGISGAIRLFNPAGTVTRKQIIAETTYLSTAGAGVSTSTIALVLANGFYDGNSNPVTGVNFLFTVGNISTGTIKIYGLT